MSAGSYRRTDDGVLGPSGKPVIVYSIVVMSGAGAAAVVSVYDGTTTTTKYDQINGSAASTATVRDYGAEGMLFPNGCYVDVDGNTTFVVGNLKSLI